MQKDTTPANPSVVAVDLPPEVKRLHDLCKLHAISSRELSLERAKLEREFLALITRRADYIVELEAAMTRTKAGIEDLVQQNPHLLGEKRTLKTPHGTIKLIATSSLLVADEAATLNKLFLRARRNQDFDATLYYRDKAELDLEALEKLDDATLQKLGIVRTTGDKFSFTLIAADLKKFLADSAPKAPVEAVAA